MTTDTRGPEEREGDEHRSWCDIAISKRLGPSGAPIGCTCERRNESRRLTDRTSPEGVDGWDPIERIENLREEIKDGGRPEKFILGYLEGLAHRMTRLRRAALRSQEAEPGSFTGEEARVDAIVERLVLNLSEREPDEETIDAQAAFAGTDLEHLHCISTPELMESLRVTLSDMVHDGEIVLAALTEREAPE